MRPVRTYDDVVANVMAMGDTRPTEDAFVELLGEGQVPPGYIWPVAFALKPFGFWGNDNFRVCWDRVSTPGFDPTVDSERIIGEVQRFEQGESLTGAALLQLHHTYSMGLVATLLAECERVLASSALLQQDSEKVVASKHGRGEDLGGLDGITPDTLAVFARIVQLDFWSVDFRFGYEIGNWDPSSPSSAYVMTTGLISRATAAHRR